MSIIGFVLKLSGVLLIVCGLIILSLAAVQLVRQMFTTHGTTVSAAPPSPGVNLADLSKLIEAIVKIPQWLLAILAATCRSGWGMSLMGKKDSFGPFLEAS